jgi:hypothetical protein
MPGHLLIQDYLADLHGLPAEVVDELTDGLLETYEHHRARGHAPDDAAHAAIAEFGSARDVVAAFDRIAPGRRTARALLATGPLVGLCWGTALITARVWTWPIPAWAPPALGAALATVIVLLLVAAQASRSRARRAAAAGAGTIALLDVLVVAGVIATAPVLPGLLQVALVASVVRACLSVRTLPGILAY